MAGTGKPVSSPLTRARGVVDALFDDPPADAAALRHSLASVDPDAARDLLIERLRSPGASRGEFGLIGGALEMLGPGGRQGELIAMLADETLPDDVRLAVITAFASLPVEGLPAFFATLPEAAARAFMTLPLIELVGTVQEDPEKARIVVETLKGVFPDARRGYLADLAAARRKVGVRAADLYRYALAEPEIALDDDLREPMLLALIEEADEAGSALIQELRARSPKKLRASFQSALLKLETARASGGGKGVGNMVEAFASNPDGQGAIVALMCFHNPDGTWTVANVCLRLTEDLRNGFVEPRATRADRDRMVKEFSDDGSIVLFSAPPGEVARLVEEAAVRTRALRSSLPADVRRSVELFARVPSVAAPPTAGARSLDVARMAAMLDRPEHRHWFFDDDDRARFGATSDTASIALAALGRSPVRARVVAMARYMARWSAWRGTADESAAWVTLADAVERDFANNLLTMAMFAKSMLPGALAPIGDALGSPGGMGPFFERFPDVAAADLRTLSIANDPAVPTDSYELHEFYCDDPDCDCQRVMLKVYARSRRDFVATINHGFSAREARAEGMPQTFLDPLHANAPFAEGLLATVRGLLQRDAAWHQRLEGHYAMVKRDVGMVVAAPVRRVGPKVGANDPCPCGSGKKYKKCHRP